MYIPAIDRFMISIHAPAKERHNRLVVKPALDRNFNPRSREGATCSAGIDPRPNHRISIHAPAKERLLPI